MKLKTKRKAMKLSQAQVAKILGITQVAYGNYELKKRQPKPDTLKKLARLYSCSIDELLEDEDDRLESQTKVGTAG